jgi:hypothetical protein
MYEIKIDRLLSMVAIVLAFSLTWFSASEAQLQPITTTTLCTDAPTCSAALLPNVNGAILRRPTSDVLGNSHVGIVIVHDSSSYINFSGCSALAQRGYTTLCVDGPFGNSTISSHFIYYGLEQVVPTVASAINYARNNVTGPAITKVVIFGHSGGGSLQPFYQNVAENGPRVCQGREKLVPCIDDNLHNLPKADGVIIFDAHPGLGFGQFTYVDPSIIVNDEPPGNVAENRDPTLDMFSVANGYDASTNSGDYAKRFERRFLKAQQDRNQELLDTALKLLRQERIFTGNPKAMGDDIPFTVVAGNAARLWQPDSGGANQSTSGLLNCTQKPHILLSRDGTRPFQAVCSVRPGSGNDADGLSDDSTLHLNVHTYLGLNTIRAKGRYSQTLDDITGIDWESSATSTLVNIRGIGKHPNGKNKTTPLLIVANSGHYFLRFDELIYENATTRDKTYAIEEGAVHGGGPCAACTRIILNDPALPTAMANAYWTDPAGNGPAERTWNFMAEWLSARY